MRAIWTAAIFSLLLIAKVTGGDVPSSPGSRAVVARIEPSLKETLLTKGLALRSPVFIRIFKQPATLELWIKKGTNFHLFRAYAICTFSGDLGPKLKEGDGQAPEGCYEVAPRQMNPNSRYHLSFNLGYPNQYDRHHRRTGSALMVHGACVSIGCYAMGNEAIEEIWTLCAGALEGGQKSFQVHCFPFPLTDDNLARHKENRWIEFWRELQPIYNSFETKKNLPNIAVKNGRYTIVER